MTYARTDALAYAADEYSTLLAQAGIGTTDVITGLKLPLDAAFRRLGTAEASLATATATDANTPALLALVDYYTLRRIARYLATRVDYTATAVEGDRPRVFDHLESLMDQSAAEAASYGYSVGGDDSAGEWDSTSLLLDILEPEPS